jgi:hypothetical protein
MKIKKLSKKNKKLMGALLLLILCLGGYVGVGSMVSDTAVSEEVTLHDGDVLVDSDAIVTSDEVATSENSDSYFAELRSNLDMDREKIIAMLKESESSGSTSDEKKAATQEKLKLLEYMEQENTIETLITNKGLPECFVVMTDSGVNVTVNTEDLDQSTVAKITEIIVRQAGVKASDIVIQDIS